LFDHVLLMDHGPIDGTDRVMEQACAQRPGWTLWRLEPIGYHQTVFNIFALRHLMRHTDADVAIFLDADEFIDVPDRTSLEVALAGLTDPDRIGYMRWRNVVPDRLDTRTISPGEPIWRTPHLSILGKVVIPRRFLARHNQAVTLGVRNHGLYFDPQHMVPVDQVGEILHLPIRSHSQRRSKVLAGAFSVMAQADRLPEQGCHWFDILWRMADGTLHDADVIGIATRYSEQGRQGTQPLSWAELQASGYTPDVAGGGVRASATTGGHRATTGRWDAADCNHPAPLPDRACAELRIGIGWHCVRFVPCPAPAHTSP
jgi:hypothetical protein